MSVHDFEAKTIDGETTKLSKYAGKKLLIVNVASKCGLTPQYTGLEALHRKFKDQNVVVLGFPCDQFGHQEPGTEAEIKEFCSSRYDVTFPMFSKIEVNGPGAHPLFKELTGGDAVKWNFTKFLVDEKGNLVKRFEPTVTPDAIEPFLA
ncbi:MAG: glutathione peroxidase [Polyangiales bacterium]